MRWPMCCATLTGPSLAKKFSLDQGLPAKQWPWLMAHRWCFGKMSGLSWHKPRLPMTGSWEVSTRCLLQLPTQKTRILARSLRLLWQLCSRTAKRFPMPWCSRTDKHLLTQMLASLSCCSSVSNFQLAGDTRLQRVDQNRSGWLACSQRQGHVSPLRGKWDHQECFESQRTFVSWALRMGWKAQQGVHKKYLRIR